MLPRRILLAAALIAAPAAAQTGPAEDVSEERLRSDLAALVGFGTRHTLSVQDDPTRGIGAARHWGESEFRKASAACGGCLEIVLPEKIVEGDRVPDPTRLVDVVAIQRGTDRPDEVVIVQGHIDSRAINILDAVIDAPGANDDGSGTALVIEAARVLSRQRYPATIVYALLSGEEQGLYGAELLAEYAKARGWTVKAVLNNDIVGGSCGSDGVCDAAHVRVFSEGPRADADEGLRAEMRSEGGENDSPSRNLSRWISRLADDDASGLAVRQIWRTDRFGRGGDHIPFQEQGYPAIRLSEAVENYRRQHQDVRVEDGIEYGDTLEAVDFPYLAKVTRLNVRALEALAKAPMPPASEIEAAVRTDTMLTWNAVPGAVRYTVWRRRTDQSEWEQRLLVGSADTSGGRTEFVELPAGDPISIVLTPDRGDDWFFGVSSVAADGSESPVASAVPGGAFTPTEAKPSDAN